MGKAKRDKQPGKRTWKLYDKAATHAKTTEKYLVRKRGDRLMDREGAVIHEAIFNPVRG